MRDIHSGLRISGNRMDVEEGDMDKDGIRDVGWIGCVEYKGEIGDGMMDGEGMDFLHGSG